MLSGESIIAIATVVNALAAMFTVGVAAYTSRSTSKLLEEQRRSVDEARAQERHERYVGEASRLYTRTMSRKWYPAFERGLAGLSRKQLENRPRSEILGDFHRLTIDLREIERQASFELDAGAEHWNPQLARELEPARLRLEDEAAAILLEHTQRDQPRRYTRTSGLGAMLMKDHLRRVTRVIAHLGEGGLTASSRTGVPAVAEHSQ